MSKLKLKWWQVKILKAELGAAEEALVLGTTGALTMDSGCLIEWDSNGVVVEIPQELPLQNIDGSSDSDE